MSDDTRRPGDDDETPVDPPTGESEVVGADWLMSQLDGEPTGELNTIPQGGATPGRAGDGPVLAWWRSKLEAADALVNPEPRPVPDDTEPPLPTPARFGRKGETDTGAPAGDAPDEDAPDEDAPDEDATGPDATVPDATVIDATVPDATVPDAFPEPAFLPEPAWTPRTPSPVAQEEPGTADEGFPTGDTDDRGWTLSDDVPAEAEPEYELEDEAETGLIPSAEPPLYQPRSARDAFDPEPEPEPEPFALPVDQQADATESDSTNNTEYDTDDDDTEYDTDDDATEYDTGVVPAFPAPAPVFRPEPAPQKPSGGPDSANDTDDLDNFSWKLSRNDKLDPLIHRDANAPTSVFPAVGGDSDDDESTRPQPRPEPGQDEARPEPAILPVPGASGPRRQTYTGPASEPASPGTLGLPPAPPRRPLRPARPARPGGTRSPRPVVLAVIAVVAVLILGGLFVLGSQLPVLLAGPVATPTATAEPAPTATAEPTVPPAPVGPAAPGEQTWTALGGGECIEPYSTPWAETFTVVDCGAAHTAQMIATGPVSADPAAEYPGEDVLLQQISLWCSAPGVLDAAAASDYSDLQVQGTYPVSAEQWADGERNYYCFATRSSGQPLTGSVAATQG